MFIVLFWLFYMFENFKTKMIVGAEEQKGAGRNEVGGIRAKSGHDALLPPSLPQRTHPGWERHWLESFCWELAPKGHVHSVGCAVPPSPSV